MNGEGVEEPGVVVVTDSAASLPVGDASRLGIEVVPMTVMVGAEEHADGALAPGDLVRSLGTEPVSTSAPSPGAFLRAIETAGHRSVLVTTVSARMSASHEAALTAAGYAGERVAVLDTGTAAGGQGLVVLAAARAAAAGATLPATIAAAERVAKQVHLVAALEDLDQLARSGRVPGIAARAGRSLHLRPFFEFADGRAVARRPAHGRRAALDRLLAACTSSAPRTARSTRRTGAGAVPVRRLHCAVLHAEAEEDAAEIAALLRRSEPGAELFVAPFSSVMVAHTGRGVVGLAWWWAGLDGGSPSTAPLRDPEPLVADGAAAPGRSAGR